MAAADELCRWLMKIDTLCRCSSKPDGSRQVYWCRAVDLMDSAEDSQMDWRDGKDIRDEQRDRQRFVLVSIQGTRRRPRHVRSRVICWNFERERRVDEPRSIAEIRTGVEGFSFESVLLGRIPV